MARVKGLNSIGYSGRIGNTIGYEWRGRMCVRSMPSHYNDAKTERQLEVRSLFRQTVSFAGQAKQALRIGLRTSSLRAQMTECNYFMRMNRDCFALEDGELAVDYENLQFSEGPVAPVAFTSVERGMRSGELVIAFDKNPEHRNCSSSDKVYVVALCRRNGVFEAVLPLPVYRRMGSITVTLPSYWEGEEVHLYGFVQDIAGRCSESCYLGTAEAIESEEEADSLFHQEFLGGDTRGCGDAEEVGARGPGGDVEGGGETRGGPVKEPVPQDVGGLDMRHG